MLFFPRKYRLFLHQTRRASCHASHQHATFIVRERAGPVTSTGLSSSSCTNCIARRQQQSPNAHLLQPSPLWRSTTRTETLAALHSHAHFTSYALSPARRRLSNSRQYQHHRLPCLTTTSTNSRRTRDGDLSDPVTTEAPTSMDQLSSRFRRTKKTSPSGDKHKEAPAQKQEESPAASSTETTTQPPPRSRDPPPTLSISTTTAPMTSTTPPNSSHSSRSTLHVPKSPFRGFPHFRSGKRARSPAPASLPLPPSPALVNQDGTVEQPAMASANHRAQNGGQTPVDQLKMPPFLSLSPQEIETKFQELCLNERLRVQQSQETHSPGHRFARVTAPETKILDRYANIQPWANNRVKLKVPRGRVDYINASPIVLRSPLKPKERPPHHYIAMQGPKGITSEHVWRMVVEQLQSPAVIVMLTETHELGMEKCYPYFPRSVDDPPVTVGAGDEFEDGFRAQVSCTELEERAGGAIQMRKINVHVEGREEDMTVWHLLYRKWPDFGVPALEDIDSFFELMRLSREKNASEENPRIVHCSAGVGRSGTFMALEHLMREVDSGDVERLLESAGGASTDLVFDTVNALREQRKLMVQAEPQFVFIYQVLRKQYMEKHGVEDDSGDEPAAKRLEIDHDPFTED
ncbi:protein-tyrosine phosphatase-like protein [Xylariaceae sp. FL0804]|nr:protein-tyrosine phosphatase-like protein [Xylariaceae sp. FL0804]